MSLFASLLTFDSERCWVSAGELRTMLRDGDGPRLAVTASGRIYRSGDAGPIPLGSATLLVHFGVEDSGLVEGIGAITKRDDELLVVINGDRAFGRHLDALLPSLIASSWKGTFTFDGEERAQLGEESVMLYSAQLTIASQLTPR